MRRWISLLYVVMPMVATAAAPDPVAGGWAVPEIRYESNAQFLKLPFNMNFGDPVAVTVSPVNGDIYVANRGNVSGPAYAPQASQILVFDKRGRFRHELAPGNNAASYVHGIRADREGFVWVADKGSDMVVKFDPRTGHAVMIFGRRPESSEPSGQGPEYGIGDNGRPGKIPPPLANMFRAPTDVSWSADGRAYVSDGYNNSRVAVFDRNGAPLFSFGEFGSGPGQFSTVHSVAVAPDGRVYIADRGNNRIQIFSADGKYLSEVTLGKLPVPAGYGGQEIFGRTITDRMRNAPWNLCITPGPNAVLYAGSGSPGRIFKLTLDGQVIGAFGQTGKTARDFGWIHGMACPSENELFVADEPNWSVKRLTLHPDREAEARALAAQR